MKHALSLFLATVLLGCAHSVRDSVAVATLPAIGDRYSSPAVAVVIFGNRNYTVSWQDMLFTVEVRSSTERVIGLFTRDPRFHTPEGVRVGQVLSTLTLVHGSWSNLGGFGCTYILPSGWRANVLVPTPAPTPSPSATSSADQQYVIDPPVPEASCPPASGVVHDLELRSKENHGA